MDGNPITLYFMLTWCIRAPRLRTICGLGIQVVRGHITGRLLSGCTESGENGAFIGRVLLERETELYLKLVWRRKQPVLHRLPVESYKDSLELSKSLKFSLPCKDKENFISNGQMAGQVRPFTGSKFPNHLYFPFAKFILIFRVFGGVLSTFCRGSCPCLNVGWVKGGGLEFMTRGDHLRWVWILVRRDHACTKRCLVSSGQCTHDYIHIYIYIVIELTCTLTHTQSVQVKLVLGHSASWRKRPTSEGYTHDWTVLVRGEDGQDIRHFVEKVVFFLHESFPKPKRGEK